MEGEAAAGESISACPPGENVPGSSDYRRQDSTDQGKDDSMSASSPPRGDVPETTEAEDDAASVGLEDEDDAIVLDPNNSDRQYYNDPFTGVKREIWRPGDGDGAKAIDYFEWNGPPVPIEKRRRFYQSSPSNGTIKRGVNEPPKYVILDDRAAHELLVSAIPSKHRADFWDHDFGGPGKLRARRPHRGRGAVGDPDVSGDDKFEFTRTGTQNDKYYFTGEKGYKPIIYRISKDSEDNAAEGGLESTPTTDSSAKEGSATKRKADGTPSGLDSWKRPKYGHNQHTPKNLMVKHGAPKYRGQKDDEQKKTSPESGVFHPRSYSTAHAEGTTKAADANEDTAEYTAQLELELENTRKTVEDMAKKSDLPPKTPNEAAMDITGTAKEGAAAKDMAEESGVKDFRSQHNAGKGTHVPAQQLHEGQEAGWEKRQLGQVTGEGMFTVEDGEAGDDGGSQRGGRRGKGVRDSSEPASPSADQGDGN